MRSIIKINLAIALALFTAYVVHVEPNASEDPYGATVRAANRLATTCDRNQDECEFLGLAASQVWQLGQVGWGLTTGEGRLVYVTQDGRQPFANSSGGRNSGNWTGSANGGRSSAGSIFGSRTETRSGSGSGSGNSSGSNSLTISGIIGSLSGGDGGSNYATTSGRNGSTFDGGSIQCP